MTQSDFPQSLSGNDMPRSGDIASMMRLPMFESAIGLGACFVRLPFDLGTSNRTGTRFGARQIQTESSPLRPYNVATRRASFERMRVADIGDVAPKNVIFTIQSCTLKPVATISCATTPAL